jgi:pimeloyl-ACP methyl ester carboxylesterase
MAEAAPPAASSPQVPVRYAAQKLDWVPCAPDSDDPVVKRAQCAFMTVPRDWNAPGAGVDLKIAVSRLRPESSEPLGSVIGNPGGPGGPGLGMPLLLHERPALAEKMELVGFDPRGTGASTNVTCAGALAPNTIDPRDRRREVLNLVAKTAKLYGEYCHVRSGTLIDYITTEQTVKDIDLLRALLGRTKINFLGYSGGSWMGAYYATYFPKNTGNFILDSNTQFTGNWDATFTLQPLGFERRFRQDFAAWAAKYDGVLHLGTSAEAVRQFYEKLRRDFAAKPVDLASPFGTVEIDQNMIDSIITGTMYNKAGFGDLAQTLVEFRGLWDTANSAGPAAAQARFDALPAARRQAVTRSLQRVKSVRPLSADAFESTFTAITCNDTPTHRGQAYWDKLSGDLGRKYPLVGWSLNQNPCAYWARPNVRLQHPTGKGAPTTLMLQSVHDPATPYEGAVTAHHGFAGSRLVTVLNEGDHGQYINGNACVDAIGDAFLITGKAPASDTSCEGVPIPAPSGSPTIAAVGRLSPLERVAHYTELLGG